ncbi:TRAP transporter small permease [Microbaculum marinisediminis]|uniref:TRAP transporter small permease protein n=1 Tax=Microbaculum marinisediminis TaxID=2931392 RepID=A0AAW5QU88_9HYPH|nr:TRAP transporter small permease [Microbaculum sp. A6E488]MCT8971505.1 TRAP transporter small permease [Microbaculum sp. A6E488]
MKKIIHWLDSNIEPILMNIAYVVMAVLVFEQVVLRFVFKTQIAWSSAVAIYMFIAVTWLGAAYNVRQRSHLNFGEVRSVLPYGAQFVCLILDAVLWVSLAGVVIYYAVDQIELLQMNFAFVPGTSDLMQWWFYLIMPFGWGLIVLRALQNLWQDIGHYRRREPFLLGSPSMVEKG